MRSFLESTFGKLGSFICERCEDSLCCFSAHQRVKEGPGLLEQCCMYEMQRNFSAVLLFDVLWLSTLGRCFFFVNQ